MKTDLFEKIKAIREVFPESKIIIQTPDRSERYEEFVDQFKANGLSGIWRIKEEEDVKTIYDDERSVRVR